MIIDTGHNEPPPPFVSPPYDHVCDMLPPGATEEQIDLAMAHVIMGEMREPKTMKTVRKKMIYHWGRIARLAETHPDVFDAILSEYAERASEIS